MQIKAFKRAGQTYKGFKVISNVILFKTIMPVRSKELQNRAFLSFKIMYALPCDHDPQ